MSMAAPGAPKENAPVAALLQAHGCCGDNRSPSPMLQVMSERGSGIPVPFPEPVSRPQLRSSALMAQATGEVLCEVAEGRVDTITWKKDGQPLPPDRGFLLSSSRSVLYLRSAGKSDCGSYSCNASNRISWEETSLNITVTGDGCCGFASHHSSFSHPSLGIPGWFHPMPLPPSPKVQLPSHEVVPHVLLTGAPHGRMISSNSQSLIPPKHNPWQDGWQEIGCSLSEKVPG